jgi:predicted alpha/beta-fold hydrolase
VIDKFTPPKLNQLEIPILILEADNDPLVEPQLREMLKKTYPTAEVQTLHAVGHFSYLNEPRTYSKILREFFFKG